MHFLKLKSIYFDAIRDGKKTVEGRINRPPHNLIKNGDLICFQRADNLHDTLTIRVSFIRTYPSFKALLEKEGLKNCLPDIEDLSSAIQLYQSFPGYKDLELEFGALAIGIELID